MSNANDNGQLIATPFPGGANPFVEPTAPLYLAAPFRSPDVMLQSPGFNLCYLEGPSAACFSTGPLSGMVVAVSAFLARRRAYGTEPGEDDLFFQIDPKHFRL